MEPRLPLRRKSSRRSSMSFAGCDSPRKPASLLWSSAAGRLAVPAVHLWTPLRAGKHRDHDPYFPKPANAQRSADQLAANRTAFHLCRLVNDNINRFYIFTSRKPHFGPVGFLATELNLVWRPKA